MSPQLPLPLASLPMDQGSALGKLLRECLGMSADDKGISVDANEDLAADVAVDARRDEAAMT